MPFVFFPWRWRKNNSLFGKGFDAIKQQLCYVIKTNWTKFGPLFVFPPWTNLREKEILPSLPLIMKKFVDTFSASIALLLSLLFSTNKYLSSLEFPHVIESGCEAYTFPFSVISSVQTREDLILVRTDYSNSDQSIWMKKRSKCYRNCSCET